MASLKDLLSICHQDTQNQNLRVICFRRSIMGRHPKAKLIQTTHTGELAIRFGRKAKNLIESD